jgi:hypothetical protein
VVCPFRRLTGLPCPGCGLTRAGRHLLRGEFREAFWDNAMVPVVLAIAAVEVLRHTEARRWLQPVAERWGERLRAIPRKVRAGALGLAGLAWAAWVVSRWPRSPAPG